MLVECVLCFVHTDTSILPQYEQKCGERLDLPHYTVLDIP